jgi:hypothetical protein
MLKQAALCAACAAFTVPLAFVLFGAPLPTLAQNGPPPAVMAQMEKIRSDAKVQAYKGLTPAHAAAVDRIVADLASRKDTDIRGAAKSIDDILTPDEKTNVVAAGAAMRTAMENARPQGGPNGGPPNGPPPDGAQRGGARGYNDAGGLLIRLDLTREQMRALRSNNAGGADRPPN